MKLKPNQVKRSCKRSQIGPIHAIQGKSRGPKRITKTQLLGSERTEQTAAATGWPSPRPMVEDARSCCLGRTPLLPGFFTFLRDCSFSCTVFWFVLCFALKKRIYLAYLVCRIHSILSLSLSNSVEEEERRRRGIRQKATSWRQIERLAL